MAYTLYYSGGAFTVNDGTLNTANTSLALPGRNYAGYGGPVDQNLVDVTENFARFGAGPVNALKGQIWFNVNNSTLNVNTSSNVGMPTWQSLVISSNTSNANLNNLTAGNINVTGSLVADTLSTGGPTIPGTITGNWTLTLGSRLNATYADLAERFEADTAYECGTVLEMGGSHEVTAVREELSENIIGVVSATAGYLMNAAAGDNETHPPIALQGRVDVKVVGVVRKGDRLVSAGTQYPGYARAAKPGEATAFNTVGRSLEDKTSEDAGKVLAAVSAKL